MNKKNFPTVMVKSPTEALKALGMDEGAKLNYSPTSGMYVVDGEDENFAVVKGFSATVMNALLDSGAVTELVEPLEETDEAATDEEVPSPEPLSYDIADLTMACGRCGSEEVVTQAIGGATLFMATNSQAETRLVCNECGNRMSLVYRNGREFTEEEKLAIAAQKAETGDANEPQMNVQRGDDPTYNPEEFVEELKGFLEKKEDTNDESQEESK